MRLYLCLCTSIGVSEFKTEWYSTRLLESNIITKIQNHFRQDSKLHLTIQNIS
jgi:hypothetical protein